MTGKTSASRLKRTTSFCSRCRREKVPAEVVKRGGEKAEEVWLVKNCQECGSSEVKLSSDARFYWLSQGQREVEPSACGAGCGCASPASGNRIGFLGGNATRPLSLTPNPTEVMSTCLALIEIVDSCNLACPTCFADSPAGTGEKTDFVPLAELQERIDGVIRRKGKIEILQLSGGEPTLHPQFFELLRWCREHEGIDYVLVNSNGVRLARDEAFGIQLREEVEYGRFQFYLQYDGDSTAERILRGANLQELKVRAIERAGELGLPLTLAMTVIPENLGSLWETVALGLCYDHVRGVSFQPMFGSGRVHGGGPRLNTADLILSLVEQSGGKVRFEDFTPLPCGDPNCATIGYLLKVGGGVRSISDFVDFGTMQGFLADRIRYRLEDLVKCGCESEPLGQLLHDLEMDERHTFRLFIKPFMDGEDWDEDRIDRCCTHVIRPDGKLDSFCRYYRNGGASVFRKTPTTGKLA